MEEKLLPEEIELSEVVLSKTNHAFDLIRQEDCVAMKKETIEGGKFRSLQLWVCVYWGSAVSVSLPQFIIIGAEE